MVDWIFFCVLSLFVLYVVYIAEKPILVFVAFIFFSYALFGLSVLVTLPEYETFPIRDMAFQENKLVVETINGPISLGEYDYKVNLSLGSEKLIKYRELSKVQSFFNEEPVAYIEIPVE